MKSWVLKKIKKLISRGVYLALESNKRAGAFIWYLRVINVVCCICSGAMLNQRKTWQRKKSWTMTSLVWQTSLFLHDVFYKQHNSVWKIFKKQLRFCTDTKIRSY